MLTLLGKKLRILRINTGETIVEMSQKLDMSTSYLSSIENGKRKIPKNFLENLFKNYKLTKEDKEDFENSYEMSLQEAKINLSKLSNEKKELSLLYARKIEGLSDEKIKVIKEFLNGLMLCLATLLILNNLQSEKSLIMKVINLK